MAKKKTSTKSGTKTGSPKKPARLSKSDRTDPRKNKSLAIRNVLAKLPGAKAADIIKGVQDEYGLEVTDGQVYMIKTKQKLTQDNPVRSPGASRKHVTPMNNSSALWIEAIKTARKLLKATGSVANAKALLEAVEA